MQGKRVFLCEHQGEYLCQFCGRLFELEKKNVQFGQFPYVIVVVVYLEVFISQKEIAITHSFLEKDIR